MGIEAFLWNYRLQEPIGFAYDVIQEIFCSHTTHWDSEFGRLTLSYDNPNDQVDIYLGKEAPLTNHVEGIMVARPLAHPDYLRQIFQVLQLGDVMHFYSDETTPVFASGANPHHYPAEILAELGTPRFIDEPNGLLPQM